MTSIKDKYQVILLHHCGLQFYQYWLWWIAKKKKKSSPVEPLHLTTKLQEMEGQKVKVKVTQLCPTLCNSMDYTVHGILQARILEWVEEHAK